LRALGLDAPPSPAISVLFEESMARSLEAKVALVTGASEGGTGRHVAVHFGAEGAKVAINTPNEDAERVCIEWVRIYVHPDHSAPEETMDLETGAWTVTQRL
jgi:NAD(P)-dependent dehydrogenase (short-subunit alcohol dehydrogenase family)